MLIGRLMWVYYRGVVGRRRGGAAFPHFFRQGDASPTPPLFWTKICVKDSPLLQLVTYWNAVYDNFSTAELISICYRRSNTSSCIAGQDQRSAVAIFLMCMSVRVCRPKLFKNLCLSLVLGVPHFFFSTTFLVYYQQISNCCRKNLTYWLTDWRHQWLTDCWSCTAFCRDSFSVLRQLWTVGHGIFYMANVHNFSPDIYFKTVFERLTLA